MRVGPEHGAELFADAIGRPLPMTVHRRGAMVDVITLPTERTGGWSVRPKGSRLMLARDGHDVTVLEADPAGRPADGAEWDRSRRGAALFPEPHARSCRA